MSTPPPHAKSLPTELATASHSHADERLNCARIFMSWQRTARTAARCARRVGVTRRAADNVGLQWTRAGTAVDWWRHSGDRPAVIRIMLGRC